jgi:hypothetical protein
MPGANNDFFGQVTFDDQVTMEQTWCVAGVLLLEGSEQPIVTGADERLCNCVGEAWVCEGVDKEGPWRLSLCLKVCEAEA